MEKAKRGLKKSSASKTSAHSKRNQVEAGSDYSKATHSKTSTASDSAKAKRSKTTSCGR